MDARAGEGKQPARDDRALSDDSMTLHAEVREIKELAKQFLASAKKEEQQLEASHAVLRVVLQQLQQLQHDDDNRRSSTEEVPNAPSDINQLVRSARSPAEMVEIVEGITSEAEFARMDEESVTRLLPALCDSINAELTKEVMSLKHILRLAMVLIMVVECYPDLSSNCFQSWGQSAQPLVEALFAFGHSREVQLNLQSLPPPLPCQQSEIVTLAAHIQDVSGVRRLQERHPQMLPPHPTKRARWGSDENGFWPPQQQQQQQHQHQRPHRQPPLQYTQGLWNR